MKLGGISLFSPCGIFLRIWKISFFVLAIAVLTAYSAQIPAAGDGAAQLRERMNQALKLKGPDYNPRTQHLTEDGRPVYTNLLILEDSPYLNQHAHNPVEWFPWGPEAFDKARRENKPIFLSIGYSTCHWCHVMERESFDNLEIAEFLNANFVAIKVDRERRPDVDNTYMQAVMMMTGQGGWPMSSFLTADGKTFYGGTYFPPNQFKKILEHIHHMWVQNKPEVLVIAERVANAVTDTQRSSEAADATIDPSWYEKAVRELVNRFQPEAGGFSHAPKFPNETILFLLERALEKKNQPELLAILNTTLTAMARGGIYDQVGGGFHRYSTDENWMVPHFEKMLYNQANLARIYMNAYRLTGNWFYQRVARQTLDYVLRDMRSKDGGFYSATDADSEGKEGWFFLWTPDEVDRALSKEDSGIVKKLYGITGTGNFAGRNILYLPTGFQKFASEQGMSLRELLVRDNRWRDQMREFRDRRVHPYKDKKIVTAWNGMMVLALAIGADILNDSRYLEAAIATASFVWNANRNEAGELQRIHLDGRPSIPATQDDYAYFSEALIKLYDVTGDAEWLAKAEELSQSMLGEFWDGQAGGFFLNQQQGKLMTRPKQSYDGAIPSGNSVAAGVLSGLAARTGNLSFEMKARKTVAAFSAQLEKSPLSYAYILLAAQELVDGQTGSTQYAAKGVIRAKGTIVLSPDNRQQLNIGLRIRPGWHINSDQPLQSDLRPTRLALSNQAREYWSLGEVNYPSPVIKSLGFNRQKLALYEGEIKVSAILKRRNNQSVIVPVVLQLQACNDQSCLAPEILTLQVSTIPQSEQPRLSLRKAG